MDLQGCTPAIWEKAVEDELRHQMDKIVDGHVRDYLAAAKIRQRPQHIHKS